LIVIAQKAWKAILSQNWPIVNSVWDALTLLHVPSAAFLEFCELESRWGVVDNS